MNSRTIRNIIRSIVCTILGAYLALLFLLNFGPTHRYLTQTIQTQLAQLLHTDVSIGDVEIGLFNRVIISDLQIKDQHNAVLLKANHVSAKIALRSLFADQLKLRTVSLLDAQINASKPTATSPTNFQFILDAFASKDHKKPSKLNLQINSIILRRIALNYDERWKPVVPHQFSPSHLHLSGINANISLKQITNNSLRLRVRSLSLNERSGIAINDLHFKLSANQHSALITDFYLATEHSKLQQDRLEATYNITNGFNHLASTLNLKTQISNATFSAQDLRPFVNLPEQLNLSLNVKANIHLSPNVFKVSNATIEDADKDLQLKADFTLNRTTNAYNVGLTSLETNHKFITNALNWFKTNDKVKQTLQRIGNIRLKISCNYSSTKNLALSVNALTDAGNVQLDGKLNNARHLSARIDLDKLNTAKVLANDSLPSNINLSANLSADYSGKHLDFKQLPRYTNATANLNIARADYKGHTFQNITARATYTPTAANISLKSNDPEALLNADADVTFTAPASFKPTSARLTADIQNFSPASIGLKTPLAAANVKAQIKAEASYLQATVPTGSLEVTNLLASNTPRGNIALNSLTASIRPETSTTQRFQLLSDWTDVTLTGELNPTKIKNSALAILSRALPGVVTPVSSTLASNSPYEIDAVLKDPSKLKQLIGTDISATSPISLRGTMAANNSSLTLFTDTLLIGSQTIANPSIYITGEDNQLNALVKAQKQLGGDWCSLIANLNADGEKLNTNLKWDNAFAKNGGINLITRFLPSQGGKTNFETEIKPTNFTLGDSLWTISSGLLTYTDRRLTINNFQVRNNDHQLTVDGTVAPGKQDSIVAQLNNIDVDYVLSLVNFHAVDFGGLATGTAVFTQPGGSPQVRANIRIPQFTFNDGLMGDAHIVGGWSASSGRIDLDADMKLPGSEPAGTTVKGYVSLRDKGLDLDIHPTHTDLDFLNRYIGGIFDNFKGNATGHVRLYGPFKKLDFEGETTAECTARIPATGVSYTVKDGTVTFSPGAFTFSNFTLTDNQGGTGTASGELLHDNLKNLRYDFTVDASHMLVYDQPQEPSLPFYSRTVGTGAIALKGWPSHLTADIALRPEAPSTFTYLLSSQTAQSKDDAMIRWHRKTSLADSLNSTTAITEAPTESSTGTDILLNLFIDLNPAAAIKIVTDERAGDAITAYGSGAIRATWHNKGAFTMYGDYTLARGNYDISLQNVIRKRLNLKPGGTIAFNGNPLDADLNLRALYTVNGVSLSDLSYSAGFTDKKVRADCILDITGKTRSPQVTFDIDLHNISEDEKQMVRQLISSEEDMTRQAICLLGMGRFLTTSSSNDAGTTSGLQNGVLQSFVSSTLTGQLNSAISSILGKESKWSFGANFNPGHEQWNGLEVDGTLQGRFFGDRLLINGNFGYRDSPAYTSNFVGDFDIRYLLNPRGTISLRAYSETNDRYFTKSTLTTQGVGISLQRDFTNLRDLFNFRRKRKNTTEHK